MDCPHKQFQANVTVNCFTDPEGKPGFWADVQVHCADCRRHFQFIGPDVGLMPDRPMVSEDGTILRAPMRPLPLIISVLQ